MVGLEDTKSWELLAETYCMIDNFTAKERILSSLEKTEYILGVCQLTTVYLNMYVFSILFLLF